MTYSSHRFHALAALVAVVALVASSCSDTNFKDAVRTKGGDKDGDGDGGSDVNVDAEDLGNDGNDGNGDTDDGALEEDGDEAVVPGSLSVEDGSIGAFLAKPGQICGGARAPGKYLDAGGSNACRPHPSGDESCDRWGCAVRENAAGDSGCPAGTTKARVADDATYFVCIVNAPEGKTLEEILAPDGLKVGEVCGGTRIPGKAYTTGNNDCSMPATTDQSCDRWGCATSLNAEGDSGCPAGTSFIRTFDNPTYGLCVVGAELTDLEAKVGKKSAVGQICGGARSAGRYHDAGGSDACRTHETKDESCDRWGCATRVNDQGDSDCPAGTFKGRTADDPTYFICVVKKP